MTTKTKRFGRIAALLAAGGLLAATLTGCAELSVEEIQASSHQIVKTGSDFWEGDYWSYAGSGDEDVPLSVNCSDFWGRCWKSEDGLIEFRYSKGKSGISNERIIFDGVEWDADCAISDFWGSGYVCAPV